MTEPPTHKDETSAHRSPLSFGISKNKNSIFTLDRQQRQPEKERRGKMKQVCHPIG
jgi:hypothetical protein